ncbi:TRIC cation channel family protein [Corynebacterium sp. S7]
MENAAPEIASLYRFLDVSGVFLMGIIGGTIARKQNFDIVGFFFLSLLTALGGGMLRDVLIGQGTVAAIANPEYLILALAGALVALVTDFKGKAWEIFQFHGDAIILGAWAVTGCVKAMNYNLPFLSCVFMGLLTGVGGGMIRDIAIGKVPSIFSSQQLYAVPAVVAAVSVYIFYQFGHPMTGMIISPLLAVALAMLSYWRGWYIPARQDFAPVNMTASQVRSLMKMAEERGRSVGRRIEPPKVRSWRHEQMEKALERKKTKDSRDDEAQSHDEDVEEALDMLLNETDEENTNEQWTLRRDRKRRKNHDEKGEDES